MTKLALRRCTPVKKGSKPISPGIARSLLNQINNKWHLDGQAKFVERDFEFEDFRRTIEFVNAIAWVANGQDHHPDLEITYNRCKVKFSTHTAGGLTVNDFICAAKIDALFSEERLKSPSPPPAKRPHPAAPAATDSASFVSPESTTQDSVQLSGLSLDSEEVEELLNTKLPDEEEEPTTQDAADEFELLDPESISPPPEPQPPPPAPQQATPAAAATEKPAIGEESSAAPGMTSTVILPPGMQAIGEDDEDEDATVILPENTAIDPEETLVGAGNSAPNLPPALPRDVEDDDEVKTVILNPTVAAKPEDETVIRPADSPAPRKPGNPKPLPSSGSVSLPPLSPKTDDDEVGTMILSSNPFNHPPPKTSGAAGTDKPQGADKQNTAGEKPVPAAAPSKPPADGEPDHMGTMILSPAEIEALNRKQAEKKPASSQKTGDDDTLIMHVNDFKKMKKDQ